MCLFNPPTQIRTIAGHLSVTADAGNPHLNTLAGHTPLRRAAKSFYKQKYGLAGRHVLLLEACLDLLR